MWFHELLPPTAIAAGLLRAALTASALPLSPITPTVLSASSSLFPPKRELQTTGVCSGQPQSCGEPFLDGNTTCCGTDCIDSDFFGACQATCEDNGSGCFCDFETNATDSCNEYRCRREIEDCSLVTEQTTCEEAGCTWGGETISIYYTQYELEASYDPIDPNCARVNPPSGNPNLGDSFEFHCGGARIAPVLVSTEQVTCTVRASTKKVSCQALSLLEPARVVYECDDVSADGLTTEATITSSIFFENCPMSSKLTRRFTLLQLCGPDLLLDSCPEVAVDDGPCSKTYTCTEDDCNPFLFDFNGPDHVVDSMPSECIISSDEAPVATPDSESTPSPSSSWEQDGVVLTFFVDSASRNGFEFFKSSGKQDAIAAVADCAVVGTESQLFGETLLQCAFESPLDESGTIAQYAVECPGTLPTSEDDADSYFSQCHCQASPCKSCQICYEGGFSTFLALDCSNLGDDYWRCQCNDADGSAVEKCSYGNQTESVTYIPTMRPSMSPVASSQPLPSSPTAAETARPTLVTESTTEPASNCSRTTSSYWLTIVYVLLLLVGDGNW